MPDFLIPAELLTDIHSWILEAKTRALSTVNATQTLLYWQIGQRIHQELLQGERAPYGRQIVNRLAKHLEKDFGNGFSEKNLRRMMQFSESFPDQQIVASLVRQLSWTHFTLLIPLKTDIEREFYAQMCRMEGWSVRQLRRKINSMLFERTALSRKPEAVIREEVRDLSRTEPLPPSVVWRDPYILDFLDLRGHFSERDLEQAIAHDMENFILELGVGFSFVDRQKRMIIDGEDHYLDLLFYHRKLKRLVAIEIKLGRFKAEHKGQMELYLRWLEKNETMEDELPPLGLILCAEGRTETIELLRLDHSGIHVAEYWMDLLPREQLKNKLHQAIERANNQIEK